MKSIMYRTLNRGKLVGGGLLAIAGGLSLAYYNAGLLFVLFSLPQFLWSGALPLLVSLSWLVLATIQRKSIEITGKDNSFDIKTKQILRSEYRSIEKDKILGVWISRDSGGFRKLLHWAIPIGLLVIVEEVHVRKGIALLGHNPLGGFLLACGVLVFIGTFCYLSLPTWTLHFEMQGESYSLTLPHREEKVNKILAGVEAGENLKRESSPPHSIFRILHLIAGSILCLFGGLLVWIPSLYFGQFSGPLACILGLRVIISLANAKKTDFEMVTKSTEKQTERFALAAEGSHPLEIIAFLYLAVEAIRFGFRTLWWDYMTIDPLVLILSFCVLVIVMLFWFTPIRRRTWNLGPIELFFVRFPSADEKWQLSTILQARKSLGYTILFVTTMVVSAILFNLGYLANLI